jgi:hypothetical protein
VAPGGAVVPGSGRQWRAGTWRLTEAFYAELPIWTVVTWFRIAWVEEDSWLGRGALVAVHDCDDNNDDNDDNGGSVDVDCSDGAAGRRGWEVGKGKREGKKGEKRVVGVVVVIPGAVVLSSGRRVNRAQIQG